MNPLNLFLKIKDSFEEYNFLRKKMGRNPEIENVFIHSVCRSVSEYITENGLTNKAGYIGEFMKLPTNADEEFCANFECKPKKSMNIN